MAFLKYTYDCRNAAKKIAGKMSWKDVSTLAKRLHGELDRTYRQKSDAAQDTKWRFEEWHEDEYRKFVKTLKREFMNFKAAPESLSVVVWF